MTEDHFVDTIFPPCNTSLGKLKSIPDPDASIVWVRLKDALNCGASKEPLLFKDGISPSDIKQGKLGNCWLLGGLACMAQTCPQLIERRFAAPFDPQTGTPVISPSGSYIIQIWDLENNKWDDIIIDDYIPCLKLPKGRYRPAFAQADGNEAWVLLLEKAVAKHFGSYAGIEGGRVDWLFKAMAGRHAEDHRRYFAAKTVGTQKEWVVARSGTRTVKVEAGLVYRERSSAHCFKSQPLTTMDLFHTIRQDWLPDKDYMCVLGAATMPHPLGDKATKDGLHFNHAYGLLDVKPVQGFTMLKLANPHGKGSSEWNGAWSDLDVQRWKKHPEVMKACGYKGPCRDGVFWMQDRDFEERFCTIYVARIPRHMCHPGAAPKAAKAAKEEQWEDESLNNCSSSGAGATAAAAAAGDGNSLQQVFAVATAKLFQTYDLDKSGSISRWELRPAIESMLEFEPPQEVLELLLTEVGCPANSELNLKQFQQVMGYMPSVEQFMSWDVDGSGKLDRGEVKRLAKWMLQEDSSRARHSWKQRLKNALWKKHTVRKALADNLMAEYDRNRDGYLDLQEFVQLLADKGDARVVTLDQD